MSGRRGDVQKQVINVKEDDKPPAPRRSGGRPPPDMFRDSSEWILPKDPFLIEDHSPRRPRAGPPKKPEGVMEWFDRNVEDELKEFRELREGVKLKVTGRSGSGHPHVVHSAASGVDVQASLRSERETELHDAVDKLAKAQAIVAFEGAVRAAEQAAASAPPELAEEAAVAGARGFQAELTSVVREKVTGVRPVEVIGYVGITRPKWAKKRTQ